jgi:two-component system, LuxR family, response regulator FixJ
VTESTPIVHVIDDDLSLRMALARLLRAAGYDVRVYPSAGEFLIAPPGDGPACLVLDVRLPGLGGLELQHALEKHEQRLPVIFLTGHGDIPMSVQAMRAGAVDFLTKPVKRASLLGAVEAALVRDAERRAGREKLQSLRDRFETLTARARGIRLRPCRPS